MIHNFWKLLKILKVPFSKSEFHCNFNIFFFWKSKFSRVDFPQFFLKFVFEIPKISCWQKIKHKYFPSSFLILNFDFSDFLGIKSEVSHFKIFLPFQLELDLEGIVKLCIGGMNSWLYQYWVQSLQHVVLGFPNQFSSNRKRTSVRQNHSYHLK